MFGYKMLARSQQQQLNFNFKRMMLNPFINPISAMGIKFHEYQAAALLQKYGIPVPPGVPIFKQHQAKKAAQSLGRNAQYVVKAQVHGGGRGLGHFKENNLKSGVHLVKTAHEAAEIADKMIGNTLITKQSGDQGFPCNAVYIVEKLKVAGEIYIAITLDRKQGCPVLVYSPHGGVSIEDVAKQDPSKIFKLPITDLQNGPTDSQLNVAASQNLGFTEKASVDDFVKTAKSLFNCFVKSDADMIEINPMTLSPDGRMMALDAKITVDDNAAFRQKEIAEAQDISTQNFKQKLARQFDLSYIHIGGNIGCLVNGAGLAMATMDIIKVHGGDPANFLDIGGSADSHQIIEAIRLLNNDANVKSVFVNIFGGILQTDLLVQSIIDASKIQKYSKPIILRMKGTNSDRAKELLKGKQQQLGIHFDDNFDTAAQMAVKLAQ